MSFKNQKSFSMSKLWLTLSSHYELFKMELDILKSLDYRTILLSSHTLLNQCNLTSKTQDTVKIMKLCVTKSKKSSNFEQE